VSDSRCRCIGKIITRDVRLVVSRQYKIAVTRPGSRAAVTLVKKGKGAEETTAETGTPSKKQRDMIAWQDYISH